MNHASPKQGEHLTNVDVACKGVPLEWMVGDLGGFTAVIVLRKHITVNDNTNIRLVVEVGRSGNVVQGGGGALPCMHLPRMRHQPHMHRVCLREALDLHSKTLLTRHVSLQACRTFSTSSRVLAEHMSCRTP